MALPNGNLDDVKVYHNEYINNITINRGNERLLQNDIYLYDLIVAMGGVVGETLKLVDEPWGESAPGTAGDVAVTEQYVYFYTGTKWGRIEFGTGGF